MLGLLILFKSNNATTSSPINIVNAPRPIASLPTGTKVKAIKDTTNNAIAFDIVNNAFALMFIENPFIAPDTDLNTDENPSRTDDMGEKNLRSVF